LWLLEFSKVPETMQVRAISKDWSHGCS